MADKKNYLDKTGLSHLWSKIKTYISGATVYKAKGLVPVCIIGHDNANPEGWYKVADSTMSGNGNTNITYLIRSGYKSGHIGILELEMRSNKTSIACWQCKWLVRTSIPQANIRIVIDGMKWTMYYKLDNVQYGRTYFIELQHRNLNGAAPTYPVNYYNSTEKESTEPVASTESSDGGRVNVANNADLATKATQDANGTDIRANYLRKSSDYLNTHPENSGTILPFMNNDIAFLKARGGSVKVFYDGVEQTINTDSMFDACANYWAMNPTGITEVVIELTLHKVFPWTNTIYVDHGSSGWRSKSVKIETINTNYADDAWVVRYTNTAQTKGNYFTTFTHQAVGSSSGSSGFNKIRLTFSNFANATIFRIAQIGVLMYGSIGLRETNMSRGTDDPIFRNITPNDDNKFQLGSSTKRWSNIYATTINGGAKFTSPVKWEGSTALPASTNLQYILGIDAFADGGQTKYINKNDMVVGKANTLATPRTINGTSFDGSKDITITATDPNAITKTQKGAANGVAELDDNGLVPSSQLPSYVDDILEYSAKSSFPTTGETGKIYVDTSTNITYRWSGSTYVEISPSLALGTTSSTAFRGDYGNTAYTHANAKGSAFSSGFYKITTNAQGHVTAVTAVSKADITALGIPAQDTTYSVATTSANGLMSSTDKSTLDNVKNTYVKKSGDTMTGNLLVSTSSEPKVQVTNGTRIVELLIGSSGTNRGVYDRETSTWIIYKDTSGRSIIPNVTHVTNTTDSTSSTTGAIKTDGGMGVAKAINGGTTITAAKALKSTEGTVDLANSAAQIKYNSTDKCIDFIFN